MAHLEASQYNFFTRNTQGHFIYNSRTGTIINTSPKNYELIETGGILDTNSFSSTDREVFTESGIICKKSDEIDFIKEKMNIRRESLRFSHIVIMPTLSCNFKCEYCFQNDFRSKFRIDTNTINDIIDYILSQKISGKTFDLTWFGGEPLVGFEEIKYFYQRLQEENLSTLFDNQTIITNASLLDKKKSDFLVKNGVKRAQVSFDAMTYIHGKKRGVVTEDGAPSRILLNCLSAQDSGLKLDIRLNLDASNIDEKNEIMMELQRHGLKDRTYIARVEDPIEEQNSNTNNCSLLKTLSRTKFAELEIEQHLVPKKIPYLFQQLTPSSHYCGATDGTMIVISPDGSLSRCWNSAGLASEEFGSIKSISTGESLEKIGAVWDDYRPTDYKECRECKVLPLCTGGCSQPRLMQDIVHPPCTPIKFTAQRILDYALDNAKIPSEKKTA